MTSDPGFYDPERIPYQKRLQEWATNARVNDIIACTAAQLIKTTAINNIVGFFIGADPTTILVIYPTIDDAKDWLANKFMPMVRHSKLLRSLIPDSHKRTAGQTTQEKHFPGGRIKTIGANSPASLRGRSFRVVIQDDLDGFKDTPEGDPSDLGDRRAANQPRALRIKFSTPTLKGTSRIWKLLELSTFDQLLCPCPKCEHAQTLEWEQVVWEPGKPATARYKCVACGALWDNRERYQAVIEGCRRDLWRSKNPDSQIKGLHMNGLYRLMGEKNSMSGFLEEWVRDYLTAKAKGEKSYQVWVNLFLALCYESAGSTIEPGPLYKRRENYRPLEMLPEEVLIIAAFVDVQGNRLEVETRGIGLGQESWGLEYRVFAGDPSEQMVWKKLDAFLAQAYTHPIRGKIRVATCLVDAGGSKKNEAYVFTETRNSRGIYASRGARDIHAPLLSPIKKAGYNSVPFYFIGTQGIKDTLHSRLQLKEPGPGFMHWPISDDFDEEYFKQLTAEKKTVQLKGENKGQLMWTLADGARNEPWDCNVGIIAAIEAANFTEKTLRQIARDNERIKAQRGLPPPPPSKVTNLDALKTAPLPLAAKPVELEIEKVNPADRTDLGKAPADPQKAPVEPKTAPVDPISSVLDPTAPQHAPISPAVVPNAPKATPWKVRGKGRSSFPGSGMPGGFAAWR